MPRSRDHNIDICRGLAMIAVVLGHCGFPYTREIYSFHVPVFFVISGYLYYMKPGGIKDFGLRLLHRLKRLYIPYVLFSSFFVITLNMAIQVNLYSTLGILTEYPSIAHTSVYHELSFNEITSSLLKVLAFSGGTNLSGAMWFLRVMFFSYILFELEHLIFQKQRLSIHLVALANVGFFILGYSFNKRGVSMPLSLDVVVTVMIFYSLGEEIRQFFINKDLRANNILFILGVSLVSCFLVYFVSKFEDVNIGLNQYNSPLLLVVSTLCGFIFLYTLSILLLKAGISHIFELIGKHTIAILGWHFLAFKLVNLIVVYVKGLPIQYVASFPIIEEGYWLFYAIFGIAIPLVFVYIYSSIIKIRLCLKSQS